MECKSDEASPGCNSLFSLVSVVFALIFVKAGSIPRGVWRAGYTLCLGVLTPSYGVGFDVMSRSHCIHPTGRLPVRLKHKKTSLTSIYSKLTCCTTVTLIYSKLTTFTLI